MADYHFVTHWSFDSPIDRVWEEIRRVDRWPTWWSYVKKVDVLEPGDETGVHAVTRMTWKTKLPYSLAFELRVESVEPPHRLVAKAQGELEGTGVWQLRSSPNGTDVQYDWMVRTNKWWMNFLSPFARPVFSWNHKGVMDAGYEGLKQRLKAKEASA